MRQEVLQFGSLCDARTSLKVAQHAAHLFDISRIGLVQKGGQGPSGRGDPPRSHATCQPGLARGFQGALQHCRQLGHIERRAAPHALADENVEVRRRWQLQLRPSACDQQQVVRRQADKSTLQRLVLTSLRDVHQQICSAQAQASQAHTCCQHPRHVVDCRALADEDERLEQRSQHRLAVRNLQRCKDPEERGDVVCSHEPALLDDDRPGVGKQGLMQTSSLGEGQQDVRELLSLEGLNLLLHGCTPAKGSEELLVEEADLCEGLQGGRELLWSKVASINWQFLREAPEQPQVVHLYGREGPRDHGEAQALELACLAMEQAPAGGAEEFGLRQPELGEGPEQLSDLEGLELVQARCGELGDGRQNLLIMQLHHRARPSNDAHALQRHEHLDLGLGLATAGALWMVHNPAPHELVELLEHWMRNHLVWALGLLAGDQLAHSMHRCRQVNVVHVVQMRCDGLQQNIDVA
mmetsp:Transcript_52425/g.170187  ORF Transcript_52425/g.170187 Transcript_52425/m.170187 type:complete len:467 (-) Transcript_52425:142-1542(-)